MSVCVLVCVRVRVGGLKGEAGFMLSTNENNKQEKADDKSGIQREETRKSLRARINTYLATLTSRGGLTLRPSPSPLVRAAGKNCPTMHVRSSCAATEEWLG